MIIIRISGIIASFELENESNVTPASLRKSLDDAGGEDVLITINSPGGVVSPGLEMFSMIQNYSGHTETRIVSMAASMGSILAFAGNKKSIESTAIYFIHNAQGIGIGDYREMEKTAKWLKDVSGLLANLYKENTTLSLSKAQELMDEETQFYGKDLENLGFETVETGEALNQSVAKVQAVGRLKEFTNKISNEEYLNDLEKVAASISGKKQKPASNLNKKTSANITDDLKNGSQNTDPAAIAGKNNTEEKFAMNEEELRAKYPDLYNAIFQAGVKNGIDKGKADEFDRVKAHITLGRQAGALELAVKNIEEKKEFSLTVSAEYQAEGMKNQDITNRNVDDENLGEIPAAGDEETTEAETEAYAEKLGKKMGVK